MWGRSFSVMVERGEGAYLIDTDGRRYLDFTSSIGVTNRCPLSSVAGAATVAARVGSHQQRTIYRQPHK